MSSQEGMLEAVEAPGLVRSGVKVEMNSKQVPIVKVAVYEGTTREQMQDAITLALEAYETLCRRLGIPVNVAA